MHKRKVDGILAWLSEWTYVGYFVAGVLLSTVVTRAAAMRILGISFFSGTRYADLQSSSVPVDRDSRPKVSELKACIKNTIDKIEVGSVCVECRKLIPGTANWFCIKCQAVVCESCFDGNIHKCAHPIKHATRYKLPTRSLWL